MSQKAIPLSLAFRVAVFFARNPEEELTSSDVVQKFGVESTSVHRCLSSPVRLGLIERSSEGPGRTKLSVYRAGPKLLHMVGASVQIGVLSACAPAPFRHAPLGNMSTGSR